MSNKQSISQIFTEGLWRSNPVLILLLGMCPTLGVTSSVINGIGMGLATTFVLVMSNLVVSSLRGIIPKKMRIPCFIVIIASFVTIVEMLTQAYTPALYKALGVFIPLIVVNCIVLGRSEWASVSPWPWPSWVPSGKFSVTAPFSACHCSVTDSARCSS